MTTIIEDEMKDWAEAVCGACEKKFKIQPVGGVRLKNAFGEGRDFITPRITRQCPSTTHAGKRIEFCSEACKEKWPYDYDCYDCGKPDSSEAHKKLNYRHLPGLRCPGCCAPVQIMEIGACDESDRGALQRVKTVSLICAGALAPGALSCGPHGSLVYVRRKLDETCEITPSAATQETLDKAFNERAARELETAKKLAQGDHNADLGKLCAYHTEAQHFGITGPRQATTHGKDCSCVTGKPYTEDPKVRYTKIPELDETKFDWPRCECGGRVVTGTDHELLGVFDCVCLACHATIKNKPEARTMRV